MGDISKPDLVIHTQYMELLLNFDLGTYFNIITLNDLYESVQNINPLLVTDDTISIMNNVRLNPTFKQIKKSGLKPQYTSYYFDREIPIYRIPYRGPRYVIWNKTDNLRICATYVDRIDKHDLYEAYLRAKAWVYNITRTESIIVFDLDETLIDRNCKILNDADYVLKCARAIYDRVVLYSHGSNLHVDDNVTKFNIDFDLVLSNSASDSPCNKNLLYLYNYFPNTRFSRATLVDDSLYNWTPEYENLLVPFSCSTVRLLASLL